MMRSSEPFHHFVDDYLAYLHEVHPTGATLDGVHTYDDHIEDFSRQAIEQHTRALSGFSRRLQDINLNDLTAVEKAEQPMVAANIQARMFELEQIRTWERSPQLYCRHALLEPGGASGLYARAASRAGPPRAVEAASDGRGSCRRPATTSRIRRASSSRSASRRSAARSTSSRRICRARFRRSTTCTCSAIWPMRRPKR